MTSTSSSSSSPTSPNPHKRPRVSPEHTLTRVRENQRRHRARRKTYIATLELKLAETEAQLAAARAEIQTLRGEREMWRAQAGRRVGVAASEEDVQREMRALEKLVDTLPAPGLGDGGVFAFALGIPTAGTEDAEVEAETDGCLAAGETPDADADVNVHIDTSLDDAALPPTGPPPCCTDIVPAPAPSPSLECTTCHTRPAPFPSESTTLCAQAYVLIAQQNFRGIDAGTIRLWLWQGYRRARQEGEGCRVENGALFRLLDYISGGF